MTRSPPELGERVASSNSLLTARAPVDDLPGLTVGRITEGSGLSRLMKPRGHDYVQSINRRCRRTGMLPSRRRLRE